MNQPNEPIRVLQVFGNVSLGGAESRTMDLYRSIDRTRVQFDFAVHGEKQEYFEEEIKSLGGRIYRLPKFKGYNVIAYRKAWKALLAEHKEWKCVHGHMTSTASLYLPIAKRAGVSLTVAHARNAGVDKGPKGILTKLLRKPLWRLADFCFAVPGEAGEAVFGKKAIEKGLVTMIPNAIEASKYCYRPKDREQLREEMGLTDKLVLGHVARFHPAKNHPFLLEVFAAVCKRKPDSVLLLLGEGAGMEAAKEKAQQLGIADKVRFLGNQSKVSDFHQVMDGFVFPSFYEGLPGSVLEAQVSGLPCLLSDTITRVVAITDMVCFMSLEESADRWADWILKHCPAKRADRLEDFKKSGFDVEAQAERMMKFYETGKL